MRKKIVTVGAVIVLFLSIMIAIIASMSPSGNTICFTWNVFLCIFINANFLFDPDIYCYGRVTREKTYKTSDYLANSLPLVVFIVFQICSCFFLKKYDIEEVINALVQTQLGIVIIIYFVFIIIFVLSNKKILIFLLLLFSVFFFFKKDMDRKIDQINQQK